MSIDITNPHNIDITNPHNIGWIMASQNIYNSMRDGTLHDTIEDLMSRHKVSSEKLAHMIYQDKWLLKALKQLWHDPLHEMADIDKLVLKLVLEGEKNEFS